MAIQPIDSVQLIFGVVAIAKLDHVMPGYIEEFTVGPVPW